MRVYQFRHPGLGVGGEVRAPLGKSQSDYPAATGNHPD